MTIMLTSLAKQIDVTISRGYLKYFRERGALLTLLFHGFFQDEAEIALNHVSPQQRMTVDHFRQIVDYFLNHGYQAITPDALAGPLDRSGKYLLITFDDGYFSSCQALPVMKEYDAPAIFFVPVNHITQNKCFWWDVVWRERQRRGVPEQTIRRELRALRSRKNSEIEAMLVEAFGPNALQPVSDIDRPMTLAEFREFAGEKEVHIGNHTMDHAMLTNYIPSEMAGEIGGAQVAIAELTGAEPSVIAYPDGRYSETVIHKAREAGLRFGITTVREKSYLPLVTSGDDCMSLGRFTLVADGSLRQQMENARSDIALRRLKSGRRKRQPPAGKSR